MLPKLPRFKIVLPEPTHKLQIVMESKSTDFEKDTVEQLVLTITNCIVDHFDNSTTGDYIITFHVSKRYNMDDVVKYFQLELSTILPSL